LYCRSPSLSNLKFDYVRRRHYKCRRTYKCRQTWLSETFRAQYESSRL